MSETTITVRQLRAIIGNKKNWRLYFTKQGLFSWAPGVWVPLSAPQLQEGKAFFTGDEGFLYALRWADQEGVVSVGPYDVCVDGVSIWPLSRCYPARDVIFPQIAFREYMGVPAPLIPKLLTARKFRGRGERRLQCGCTHLDDGKYYTSNGHILYAFDAMGCRIPAIPSSAIKLFRAIDPELTGLNIASATIQGEYITQVRLSNGFFCNYERTEKPNFAGALKLIQEKPSFFINVLPGFSVLSKISNLMLYIMADGKIRLERGGEAFPLPSVPIIERLPFEDDPLPIGINTTYLQRLMDASGENVFFGGIEDAPEGGKRTSAIWATSKNGDLVMARLLIKHPEEIKYQVESEDVPSEPDCENDTPEVRT